MVTIMLEVAASSSAGLRILRLCSLAVSASNRSFFVIWELTWIPIISLRRPIWHFDLCPSVNTYAYFNV